MCGSSIHFPLSPNSITILMNQFMNTSPSPNKFISQLFLLITHSSSSSSIILFVLRNAANIFNLKLMKIFRRESESWAQVQNSSNKAQCREGMVMMICSMNFRLIAFAPSLEGETFPGHNHRRWIRWFSHCLLWYVSYVGTLGKLERINTLVRTSVGMT